MRFFGKQEFEVEALSAYRVADKLARAGVEVCSFRVPAKNTALFTVNGKDTEKVFAILRGSCYNVKKVRPRGFAKAVQKLIKCAGLLAGVLLFFVSVLTVQTRVLEIRIEGSGAYYRDEVLGILSENGVKRFSSLPADSSPITARIVALPRVSFCALKKEGGIVTVTVEVTDERGPLTGEPLLSPASGVVDELVVVRGTPLVNVGDSVLEGDEIVKDETLFGEEAHRVIVIAFVRISFPFAKEYEGSEESAILNAELEFGKAREVHTTKTGAGWLVEGVAVKERSLNLG